ncbi:Folate transporter 1 [Heterocephalus glaber]|uniref:Folate transporter 1 n=1 Tax=Heterocephalus glaber TaxID=10181 RepID=G5ATA5_HETGA|nr:Folate transporter 1 [Heterocephalus glaber]
MPELALARGALARGPLARGQGSPCAPSCSQSRHPDNVGQSPGQCGALTKVECRLQSPPGYRAGLGGMMPSGQVEEKQAPEEEPGPSPEHKAWRRLVFFLCFYGFMAQMRPGESFITPYLLGPCKNFTREQACGHGVLGDRHAGVGLFSRLALSGRGWGRSRSSPGSPAAAALARAVVFISHGTSPWFGAVGWGQVTNEITPVLSYSYLAVLVPIFLLTDYLTYKPVLVLQGLSYVCVWLLLLFGSSVPHMQLMEAVYSITMAARIAYSSYIFSLVRPSRYQRMASYSRATVLLGVFTSSVLGQLLVTVGRVSFSMLNYISLGFLIFSLGLSLFLKRPKRSLFFNRSVPVWGASPCELDQMHPGAGRPEAHGKLGRMLHTCRDSFLVRMLYQLGASLHLPQLRLWSLWWIFNSAGYYLIVYYVHILWNVEYPTTNSARVYNGAADAASTLLGAIMSFAAGFLKIRWALWSKLVIAAVTASQAGLVFLLYNTKTLAQHPYNIWLCYAAFVIFRGAYQFLVPIATFRIASSLSKELCALVFGINTFLATVLKTCITLVVSDKRGLGLPVHSQGDIIVLTAGWAQGRSPGLRDTPPVGTRPQVPALSAKLFRIYFVYFLVLSVIYFLGALLDVLHHFWRSRHQPLPVVQELQSPSEKAVQALSVQDGALGGLQPSAAPLPPEDGVGRGGVGTLGAEVEA